MKRRYDRQGVLAIDPRAFFGFFFDPPDRANESAGNDVEVVTVRGPLEHHDGWWCDSYDAITERVELACKSAAKTIVLRIDSPGGDAAGCFETARGIHDKCAAAGKQLVAYVDGSGFSAAYALACAADRIVMGQSSLIGSVGVIASRFDFTSMDERYGVKVSVITSGERKADGHPSTSATPAELAELQHVVDELAGVFFDFVSERRGLDREAIEALEAGIFAGRDALKVGLADSVSSFEALLGDLAKGQGPMAEATKLDDARAALEEAAKGEGEEAEKAKRALAAMDEDEESEDDSDKEKAEGEDESDEDEEKDAKAAAAGTPTLVELAKLVNKQGKDLADVRKTTEATRRKELLASRPDLDKGLVKLLSKKPLAEVETIVGAIKPPKKPKLGDAAATAVVAATRPEGAGAGTTPHPSPEIAAMDRVMGTGPKADPIKVEKHHVSFGVMTRDQAAARAAQQKAGER